MKEYPDVDWEFQRAGSATEQASQIDAMVQKGITGLVVLPFDSDTPLPSIKKAKQQGIYIVSIDRGLREPVADLYLAGDNNSFGTKSRRSTCATNSTAKETSSSCAECRWRSIPSGTNPP